MLYSNFLRGYSYAGASAPSAGNIQPWTFYAVVRQKVKEQLAAAAFNQKFIANAPVVIVFCALPEDAAATQNILLAADAFGLGSCWVGAFDESTVFNALNCQPGERPVAIVPLGFSTEDAQVPASTDLSRVVRVLH
jgi:nitroreductase